MKSLLTSIVLFHCSNIRLLSVTNLAVVWPVVRQRQDHMHDGLIKIDPLSVPSSRHLLVRPPAGVRGGVNLVALYICNKMCKIVTK